jgi:hypothetical protein
LIIIKIIVINISINPSKILNNNSSPFSFQSTSHKDPKVKEVGKISLTKETI